MKISSVITIIVFCLSGCIALPIPHDRLVAPVAKGIVFDADTREPVADARVSVVPRFVNHDEVVIHDKINTTQDGKFRLAASIQTNWYYFTPLNLENICGGTYTVEKEGYQLQTFTLEYFGWAGNDGICDSKPIQKSVALKRVGNNEK
jgi:hypothetical protein